MEIENPYSDEIEEVIVRVLQKTASVADLEKVRTWLSLDLKNVDYYNEFRLAWQSAQLTSSLNDYNQDQAWERLSREIERTPVETVKSDFRPGFFTVFWRVAAIIVIAFGLGMGAVLLVSRFTKPSLSSAFTQNIVPYGSKSQVILPDGSVVWLNAGTTLKYSQDFNHGNREVFLDGEAYFDVKKNTKLPFWVKTYGVNIEVVGTAFNVKAYRDERTIETTVERGKVKVYGSGEVEFKEKEIVLLPKQKATLGFVNPQVEAAQPVPVGKTVQPGTPTLQIEKNVATELYTSWKDKRWVIEKEELGSLAVKIARRYDVTIEFGSESIKHYVFSGTIENETIDQVVEIISLTAPISYSLDKKHLILKENKSFITTFH